MAVSRNRRFRLFIDAHGSDVPEDQWHRSLEMALRGLEALDDEWKPYAWVIEYREQPSFGGIPVVRNVVHVQHGERMEDEEQGP